MKKLLLACLLLSGCASTPMRETKLPSTSIGEKLEQTSAELTDQVAGNLVGAERAISGLPASREKTVVGYFISDAIAITGRPIAATEKVFIGRAEALLSQDIAVQQKAESDRLKARDEAAALKVEVEELKKQHELALATEREEAKAAVAKAKLEGEQQIKKIIAFMGYGLSFLLIVAGAACFPLASYIPQLGPRVAFGLILAGVATGATATAFLTILNHPWIIWTGLGVVVAILLVAAAIAYTNHLHHKE